MTGAGTIRESRARGVGLSLALHLLVALALAFWLKLPSTTEIVAAGPGEGGEGGGGAIEVGVADTSAILGFAKPQTVSFVGDQQNSVNNTRLENARPKDESSEEVMPSTERDPSPPDAVKTDRPVANQQERIFTGKEERGRSESQSAQVGRSFGTPTPATVGGVGLGSGGGFGGGTGLPGGSEYGRRIQAILSRNYAPPAVETPGVEYVIILLRIGRDGKILSISNGRVSPAHFRQRSSLAQLNYAAERAVLAADPLPPFPAGFLAGVQEAQAQVWFRYPK
jgi:hypothetical protein